MGPGEDPSRGDRQGARRQIRARQAALGQSRCGRAICRGRQESGHARRGIHRQPISELHDRRLPLRPGSVLCFEGRRNRPGADRPQVPGLAQARHRRHHLLGRHRRATRRHCRAPPKHLARLSQPWNFDPWCLGSDICQRPPAPPLSQQHLLVFSHPRSRGVDRLRTGVYPSRHRPRPRHDGVYRSLDAHQHARDQAAGLRSHRPRQRAWPAETSSPRICSATP